MKKKIRPKNQAYLARLRLQNAIKRGHVVKPKHCESPGCTNSHIEGHHHEGYEDNNALNVLWLCEKHHLEIHGKKRKEKPLKSLNLRHLWYYVEYEDGTVETRLVPRLLAPERY